MPFKLLFAFYIACVALFTFPAHAKDKTMTAYDFSFPSLDSKDEIALSQYKGSVILVVNTASKCGFTEQYKDLQKLYDTYKDKGLVVLGVPSNDFGGQEPGTEKEIKKFCAVAFGINFPMTGKVHVKGKDAHPFYKWASAQGIAPKWNFHKYLIAKDGRYVDWYASTTKPDSKKITQKIEELLAE